MQKLSELIATFFYIGKIEYAPGTIGSLPAFFIAYLVMKFALNYEFSEEDYLSLYEKQLALIIICELICFVLLLSIGTLCTHIYIKDRINKDPQEVVIDEVVGQLLTIILCSFSSLILFFSPFSLAINVIYFDIIFMFVLPFSLFRIFDIYKPWPIDWADEKCKGALGVMLDDILAAIFASVSHYIIVLSILHFYH